MQKHMAMNLYADGANEDEQKSCAKTGFVATYM